MKRGKIVIIVAAFLAVFLVCGCGGKGNKRGVTFAPESDFKVEAAEGGVRDKKGREPCGRRPQGSAGIVDHQTVVG